MFCERVKMLNTTILGLFWVTGRRVNSISVQFRLRFLDPQYGICFMLLSDAQNFGVAPKVLENLCLPHLCTNRQTIENFHIHGHINVKIITDVQPRYIRYINLSISRKGCFTISSKNPAFYKDDFVVRVSRFSKLISSSCLTSLVV